MASRYLVATGNWNSTSVWSTSSGGSSGASVPGNGDMAYLDANYILDLSDNVNGIQYISHTNGTLNLNSYSITYANAVTPAFSSAGSNVRHINMGTARLEVNGSPGTAISLSGTNLTFDAGTSEIVINSSSTGTVYIAPLDYNLGNVTVNIVSSGSQTLAIVGNPTFNNFTVNSMNSSVNTVKFTSGNTYTFTSSFSILGKLNNNISLVSSTSGSVHNLTSAGTIDVKYVDVKDSSASGGSTWDTQGGTDNGNNTGWNFLPAPNSPPTLTGISTLTGVSSLTFS